MDILSDPLFRNVIFPVALVAILVIYYLIRGIITAVFRPPGNREAGIDVDKNSRQPMLPGESIGSIGVRLGEDIRDVWAMGYSDDQINGVLMGEYSLNDLYKMDPEGNSISPKGREIMATRGHPT